MQILLIKMDTQFRIIFTVVFCVICTSNAFDFRRTEWQAGRFGQAAKLDNMKLPIQNIRPLERRRGLGIPIWTLNPPLPVYPLPPFNEQSRVRIDRQSMEAMKPEVVYAKETMISDPKEMLEKVVQMSDTMKNVPMTKLDSVAEALPAPMKSPTGSLDVLQDVKGELKEASMMPMPMKEAVNTLGVGKLDDIASMKENTMDIVTSFIPQVMPKDLEGIVEMKDGLITFPVSKLSEVAQLLSNLKDAGMDKLQAPMELIEVIKTTPLEKLEGVMDMKDSMLTVPSEKLSGMPESIKNAVIDKMSSPLAILGDLKAAPVDKVENLMDLKPDMIPNPMEKLEIMSVQKVPVITGLLESVKNDVGGKIDSPLQTLEELKKLPMSKAEDLMDMKSTLVAAPIEKMEEAMDMKNTLMSAPVEKLSDVKAMVTDKITAPMEVLNALKEIPMEKIEDLKSEPVEKLADISGALGDMKDMALDKMEVPLEMKENLGNIIPTDKLDGAMEVKDGLMSAPLEKVTMIQDVKNAPMEDMKDVVVNAFQQSMPSTGNRKEYFKQLVSMMSKEELGSLVEALLNAMGGLITTPQPKVEQAKEDLQEAVHELIEKNDVVMDPGRKEALEELEHVLDDMKPSASALSPDVMAMPITMIMPNKETVLQPKSMESMDKQESIPDKAMNAGQSRLAGGASENGGMQAKANQMGSTGSMVMRMPMPGQDMMNQTEGRRRSVRSIVYGIGTTPQELAEFLPPSRLRLPLQTQFRQISNGGPPDPYPRSTASLTLPLLSPGENATVQLLEDIKAGLRFVLQTKNEYTFAIHGSSTTGTHAILDNLIEPGDKVLVLIHGYWGEVMANIAERLGADVVRYKKTLGSRFSIQEIESALKRYRPNLVAVVNAESSTTVKQPLDGVGDLCHRYGALLVADVVAVAGIEPVLMDKHKIDAVSMGSQKGFGANAGLAAVSFSPRAVEKVKNRRIPPRAYQTDLELQWKQWQQNRESYRQSLSMPLLYSLREGLASIVEEGIENNFRRHAQATDILHRGFAALGLEHYVKNPEDRMVSMSAALPPRGKDPVKIARYMFKNYNIDISSGFGETSGKMIRIAIFGSNADSLRVINILRALKNALNSRETNL